MRLERAIAIYKRVMPWASNDKFIVTWHPFTLDPTLPDEGVDTTVQLEKRFGHDRVVFATALLGLAGEGEGVNFTLDGKIGPTRDAHRLIRLARSKSSDIENKLVTELFKAHFEDGRDITSREMLINAGEKAGLYDLEVEKWLAAGRGGDDVDREVKEAVRRGVTAVPDITINNTYKLSGVQDTRTFLEVFLRVKKSSDSERGQKLGGNSMMGDRGIPMPTYLV